MTLVKTGKLIVIFCTALIVLGMFFYFGLNYPIITGMIIGQAGNVTQFNIEQAPVNNYWYGVYGSIGTSYSGKSLSFSGSNTNIARLNLNLTRCFSTELYATTLSSITWVNVVPATPADIDSYLGLPNTDLKSGSQIFTGEKFFNIYGSNRLTYFTTTNATMGSYDLGILKQGSTLILLTNIVNDSVSFNNESADYQMMVPAPLGSTVSYNFFLDPADTVTCGLNNAYPTFLSIIVSNFTEGQSGIIQITGFDADYDSITISADNNFTIIQSNNTAIINWTPNNYDSGFVNITFSITDFYSHSTNQTITFYIEPVNDPPIMSSVGDIEAYLHEPVLVYVYATDIDNENTFVGDDSVIEFDTRPSYSWLNFISLFNSSGNNYYGLINFTPYASHRGVWDFEISATDGIASVSENITMTVGYCGNLDSGGDPRCESDYEDCSSCPQDCGECNPDTNKHMTIQLDKTCIGKNVAGRVVELVDRATCAVEGEIINNREVCGNVSSASVSLYIAADEWELVNQYTTNEDGTFDFEGNIAGRYRLVAEKRRYHDAYKYFGMDDCIELVPGIEDLSAKETVIDEAVVEKEVKLEEPSPFEDIISKKGLIFFYAIVIILSLIIINIGYHFHIGRYERYIINSKELYKLYKPKLHKIWFYIKDFLGF